MYCILITGIPAAGKSTVAKYLSQKLKLPVISKDAIKELLFDDIGFQSREEKVRLGIAAMNAMYYFAQQLMKQDQPFILENNFESASRDGLMYLLGEYGYRAITITLTGDYACIYRRFVERNKSPERHRGHVVNDCYPEKEPGRIVPTISYESYVKGIKNRGMDSFTTGGPALKLDMTDFSQVDLEAITERIRKTINTLR